MKLVTAVIPTRGGIDLGSITLWFPDDRVHSTIVYDNSERVDLRVFSRYVAAEQAPTKYIYTQDDDCIVSGFEDFIVLFSGFENEIVCNMPLSYRPNYLGTIQLLGFGSVFHRSLIRPTFSRYFRHFPIDDLFLIECDRVFTGLNVCRLVDVPITHLPHATASDRLYRQSDHAERRREIERRIAIVLENERQA